jgi:DNA (cytosine-5)-methyltransferase 1
MIRISTLSVGQNRGQPRIWIEGRFLEKAGFEVGTNVDVRLSPNRVVIKVTPDGERVVSGSRKAGRPPVLDLNCAALRRCFEACFKVEVRTDHGRIVITPARTARKRAARRHDGTVGSAFSGGGLLDEAARQAGYTTLFGIEQNPDYADIWQANHSGQMYQGCISKVDLAELPQVDLLIMGIPCQPFSAIRRQSGNTRRDSGDLPETHEMADLSVWGLMLTDAVNPSTVVIEQVPGYLNSGIGTVTVSALKRMGYTVDSRVIRGTDYGACTSRRRCVLVANDGGFRWPKRSGKYPRLGDLLLSPDEQACEWFNRDLKPWLFDHWDRQRARGNSFASQQITPETHSVQAITKRYFAGQGDNPVVKDVRPGREGWFRWLTVPEVKRIMGLRDDYDLGPTKTTAGEVLGQGVLVDVFRKIIRSIASGTRRRTAGAIS